MPGPPWTSSKTVGSAISIRGPPPAAPAIRFRAFWNRSLERGVAEIAPRPRARSTASLLQARGSPVLRAAAPASDRFALVLYPTVGMLDGRHGHNAWLHELPDPVTKVTWDNYACFLAGRRAPAGRRRRRRRARRHQRSGRCQPWNCPPSSSRASTTASSPSRSGTVARGPIASPRLVRPGSRRARGRGWSASTRRRLSARPRVRASTPGTRRRSRRPVAPTSWRRRRCTTRWPRPRRSNSRAACRHGRSFRRRRPTSCVDRRRRRRQLSMRARNGKSTCGRQTILTPDTAGACRSI